MSYSIKSLKIEEENGLNFFETILTPVIILEARKNSNGNINNFKIKYANYAASLSLDKNKNMLFDSLLFEDLNGVSEIDLFRKLSLVEKKRNIFYRKNFKGYPFNNSENLVRVKASKYGDDILLSWIDSPSESELDLFSSSDQKLQKSLNNDPGTIPQIEGLAELYNALGNTLPYGGWMSDPSGRLLYISDAFLELFPTTREDVFKKGWISLLPEIEKERIGSLWKDSLKSRQVFNAEFQLKSKDNIYHSILSSAHPFLDEYGKIKYWVGVHLKIDEQKENEKKLNELLEKYKHSNDELQQFAYIASHDLQEPLRMVTSFTQLLERRYGDKLDTDGKEFVHFAVDGASRMKNLIDGLLSYSRVLTHSKKQDILNIEKVLNDLVTDLSFIIEENKAKIIYDNLPVINADKNQIYQLFQNLITNGLKYRSAENPVIKISAKEENSEWLFEVADNGIGIDKKFFDKIFVIFQRLHSRDKYDGTGIGLAISKRIVERLGGKIWVESELNKGSSFYFTIPKK